MHDFTWSKAEKTCARQAFDRAYAREMQAIKETLQQRVQQAVTPRDIWAVHDFLSEKRKEIDDKYNYRYSQLIFVFGRLLGEGFLNEEELSGLDPEKQSAIQNAAHVLWRTE